MRLDFTLELPSSEFPNYWILFLFHFIIVFLLLVQATVVGFDKTFKEMHQNRGNHAVSVIKYDSESSALLLYCGSATKYPSLHIIRNITEP